MADADAEGQPTRSDDGYGSEGACPSRAPLERPRQLFVFLLQVRHALDEDGPLYLFAVFSALVWALWVVKVALSGRYRPWRAPHATTASVVIPVVDEPLDLFADVLRRITAQQPHEVIVVINGPRNTGLEARCRDAGVDWTWTPVAGKRNAVRIGTERATGEILVLVDSDTRWTPDTLAELMKPFADRRVGGVTTRQRIWQPTRSWITRWADWLENSRALYAMPAQSVLGQIGCLPGRTIAFRRQVVLDVMPDFLTQRFLGVFLEVSDDRTLTNLTLKQGYRTVYQYTSLVYTDAPTTWRKLARQQLRWARGSQYNTVRMLPWMLGHAPLLALFFVADIVLPFLLLGAVMGGVWRWSTGTGINYYSGFLASYGMNGGTLLVIVLTFVATGLSMSIRQMRHIQERPSDALRMPVFVLISTLFLMPIRICGFFRMAHVSGWGTRKDAYAGVPDDASSLTQPPCPQLPCPQPSPGTDNGTPDNGTPGNGSSRPRPARDGTSTAVLTEDRVLAIPAVNVRRPAGGAAPHDRRFNVLALLPYVIGTTIIALELMLRG